MRLLLYCTKNKWRLFFDKVKQVFTLGKVKSNNDFNGKIVAECDFEVEEIRCEETSEEYCYVYDSDYSNHTWMEETGLPIEEIDKYLNGKDGYAINIKNLNIFDKPRELSEYYKGFTRNYIFSKIERINTAPQNMMYAYKTTSYSSIIMDKYVLISIKPEELCKILNGNKTIEIRKKVLKEML